jgi:hypothetical protein
MSKTNLSCYHDRKTHTRQVTHAGNPCQLLNQLVKPLLGKMAGVIVVFNDDTELYDIPSIISGTAYSKGIR